MLGYSRNRYGQDILFGQDINPRKIVSIALRND